MRVMVTRTGSPYFVQGHGTSAYGEWDTQGVVDYLRSQSGIDVCYFGPIRGGHLLDNVLALDVDVRGFDELTSGDEIDERLEDPLAQLKEFDPQVCIEVFGATPSWSWPDNPNIAGTHGWCIRYSAPCLRAMNVLNIPRVGIVTDPKCYKRDLEMATMWKNIRPVAVLSQEDRTFKKHMQGIDYLVHCVYSGCEFWSTAGMEQTRPDKIFDLAVMAHTHINNPRLAKGRDAIWSHILDEWLKVDLLRNSTCIIGKGWDKFSGYDPDTMIGVLKTWEAAIDHIGKGLASPMIPQWPGFNTTKPRLHTLVNSCPMLFGTGIHSHTYDMDERILPLNHPARIPEDNDGKGLIRAWEGLTDEIRQDAIDLAYKNTTPQHDLLDDLLSAFDCKPDQRPDTLDPMWYLKFGGYIPQGDYDE